jgi:hypothetical protein
MLQGKGQSVGRGPGQSGGEDEIGEAARSRRDGLEHGHGLVDDADTARLVHKSILVSHNVRCQGDDE